MPLATEKTVGLGQLAEGGHIKTFLYITLLNLVDGFSILLLDTMDLHRMDQL